MNNEEMDMFSMFSMFETDDKKEVKTDTKEKETVKEESKAPKKEVKTDAKKNKNKKEGIKKDNNSEVAEKCKQYNKLHLKVYADEIDIIDDKEVIDNIDLEKIRKEQVYPSNPEFGQNTKWHLVPFDNEKEAYLIPISPFYCKG